MDHNYDPDCDFAYTDFQGRDRLSTRLYKRPSFYEGDDVHDHGQRPFDHAGNQQELLSNGGRVVARLKKYQRIISLKFTLVRGESRRTLRR
jgi:hypothetical protein